jgi:hypothetical protein
MRHKLQRVKHKCAYPPCKNLTEKTYCGRECANKDLAYLKATKRSMENLKSSKKIA